MTTTFHRLVEMHDNEIGDLLDLDARVNGSYEGRWEPARLEQVRSSPEHHGFVARQNGKLVGFLFSSPGDDGSTRIERFAADTTAGPVWVGAALLARLLEHVHGSVTTSVDPQGSVGTLLQAFGFRVVKTGRTPVLALPARGDVRVWYVFNSLGMLSGHMAHIPNLVTQMGQWADIEAVGYGSGDLPPFTPSLRWVGRLFAMLRRAKAESVDVMFVRIHWPLAVLLKLAGRVYGGWRVALWSSGGDGQVPGVRATLRTRARRVAFRWVVRHVVDCLVTGPPTLVDEYARRYRLPRERVLLAANDIDLANWQAAAKERQADAPERWQHAATRALYVHGIDPMRGGDRLPALGRGLTDRLGGSVLLAVGDGPLYAEVARSSDVLAVGRLPNQAVPPLMAAADVLFVPSRQEGFPRVVLEAMAVGCPPLCFDVGGCRDVVGAELADMLIAGSIEEMLDLAVLWCTTFGNDSEERLRLVERAAEFDTAVVGRRTAAALLLLGHGTTATASRLAEAGWHATFR